MRVRARKVDPATAPEAVRPHVNQTFVTPGKEYEVQAISAFKVQSVFPAIAMMLIVDDLGFPDWKPAWLFYVVEQTIPSDWICFVSGNEQTLSLGPDFVASGPEEHDAMMNGEPETRRKFWDRVQTQQDMAAFINKHRDELKAKCGDWSTIEMGSFLDVVAKWAEEMEGYYQRRGLKLSDVPPWKVLADILMAALLSEQK